MNVKRWPIFCTLFLSIFALVSLTNAQSPSLYDVAQTRGELAIFVRAVDAQGLAALLKNNGPFTVLAPNDSALASRAVLTRQDVLYHVIPGGMTVEQMVAQSSVPTALGKNITVRRDANGILLNGVGRIVSAEIPASNGRLYIIDTALTSTTAPAPSPQPNQPVTPPAADGAITVNITNAIVQPNIKRLGINLGQFHTEAAGFMNKNIMPNPGFESAEYGMTFETAGGSATRIQAIPQFWLPSYNNEFFDIGQPVDFWNGARFEVLSGTAAGRQGTISDFTHEGNRYTFYLNGGGATIPAGSVISVFKEIPGFQSNRNPNATGNPNDKRPNSPGQQSLLLSPAPDGASFTKQLDTQAQNTGDPAVGKLLQIDGAWTFSIYGKALTPNAKLRVRFTRVGGNVFMDQTFGLSQGWQQFQRNFTANDPQITGVPGNVSVQFFAVGGDVLIDDVRLQRSSYTNPTEFSDRVVEAMRDLHPGVVRFWASQLNSSLDNMIASEFAKQPTGFSPKFRHGLYFTYSLHEMLELCDMLNAEPWIVIPPTFSQAEVQNLIAYLAAPASHPYGQKRAALGQSAEWTTRFPTIHIEYGNEVWGSGHIGNDPFAGATLGNSAAQILDARYELMRRSPYFNANKFDLVMGGQSRFLGRQQEFERISDAHDSIALAPYYGVLERFENDAVRYNPLYAHAVEAGQRGAIFDNVQLVNRTGNGTNIAIYEINLHAIEHQVPLSIRNDFLTSQGAAISLPLTMLHYMRELGVRDQAVWELAEFSTAQGIGNGARLFGVLRDVEATFHKRPTYLALQATNKVMFGDMLQVNTNSPSFVQQPINRVLQPTDVPYVQAFAFRDGNRYGVALFNVDLANARDITLNVPMGGSSGTLYQLAGDLHADNEETVQVRLQQRGMAVASSNALTLPPHSLTTIVWSP